MPVKDFLPVGDVKNTTEKAVKQKPSIQELTTIEVPGKPAPADLLLDEPTIEKKKTRKKTPKSEPSKISKKDVTLIITEKPQAAEKIAKAIGNARKYQESGVSYFEIIDGEKTILVASAVGHLFNLTYQQGQKGWPVFETEWVPSSDSKHAAFTKKYALLLSKLAKQASNFIVATDYDVEGEVIGWNVLRFICKMPDAKRMKYSTLTSEELKKAFENPEKTLNWGNAFAGEARHIIDWLYGINLSRALMSAIKTSGSFKILSIGRVQGPALKIIVDREREIKNFKPTPYWQAFAYYKNLEFKHPKDITDKSELEKFKNIKSAEAKTESKEIRELPPVPFDLTTLQREAYHWLKLSPSETLQLAQKLYLAGAISYPRTSSQKIPDAIKPLDIIKKLSKKFQEAKLATRKKPVEGQKTDPAHPSIYPTGEFVKLAEKEEKLYQLIVKRFLSAFSPDLITANKYIKLETPEKINFTCSGYTVIDAGWTKVYPTNLEETNLPDINGPVNIDEVKIVEKMTSPPSRYSPTSLVSILEKKNLGTKATRSMIVETLFDRGYLDGKSIEATPLGMKLIETLEEHSSIIIDENLTRQIEEELESFQETPDNLQDKELAIINKAKTIIKDIAREFKAKEIEIGKSLSSGLEELRKEQNENNTLMPCPTCKSGNLRILFNRTAHRSFVACSNYPNCKQTYSLPPNALIKKADNKVCPADNFPKLLAIRKAKRPWEFCFNPDCPIEKEKRESYKSMKDNQSSS